MMSVRLHAEKDDDLGAKMAVRQKRRAESQHEEECAEECEVVPLRSPDPDWNSGRPSRCCHATPPLNAAGQKTARKVSVASSTKP